MLLSIEFFWKMHCPFIPISNEICCSFNRMSNKNALINWIQSKMHSLVYRISFKNSFTIQSSFTQKLFDYLNFFKKSLTYSIEYLSQMRCFVIKFLSKMHWSCDQFDHLICFHIHSNCPREHFKLSNSTLPKNLFNSSSLNCPLYFID